MYVDVIYKKSMNTTDEFINGDEDDNIISVSVLFDYI